MIIFSVRANMAQINLDQEDEPSKCRDTKMRIANYIILKVLSTTPCTAQQPIIICFPLDDEMDTEI